MEWIERGRRRLITWEFVRFCAVGVTNTLHHYVWYIFLSWWISYEMANVFAFFAAMIGSYYLNNYLTFRTRPSLKRFIRFPLAYFPQMVAAYAVPYICIRYFAINAYAIPLISTLVLLPVTFLLMRFLLCGHYYTGRSAG